MGPLGVRVGRSWSFRGVSRGGLEAILERLGGTGGGLGAPWGRSWDLLGHSWGALGAPGTRTAQKSKTLIFYWFLYVLGDHPPPGTPRGTPRGTPPAGDPGGRVGKGLPNRLRHWFQFDFDLFVVESIFLSMSIEGDCRYRLRSISLSMSIDVTTINSSHTPTSRRIFWTAPIH